MMIQRCGVLTGNAPLAGVIRALETGQHSEAHPGLRKGASKILHQTPHAFLFLLAHYQKKAATDTRSPRSLTSNKYAFCQGAPRGEGHAPLSGGDVVLIVT